MSSSGTKRESNNAADVKTCSNCLLADGKPCLPCADFLDLESKIVEAEIVLKNLISQQEALRLTINTNHEPMIHRLPGEIAAQIFEFCLPPSWFASSELWGPNSRRPEMYAPLYISGVCRTWRQIAMANPRWWRVVPVFISHQLERHERTLENVEEWLRRAGNDHPLSFHVWAKRELEKRTGPSNKRNDPLSNIFALINRQSHRWQNLHLSLSVWNQGIAVRQMCGIGNGAPILKNLRFTSFPFEPFGSWPYGTFAMKGSNSRPAPSVVEISRLRRVDIQWHNVTTVDWQDFGLEECLVMFREAKGLVKCLLGYPTPESVQWQGQNLEGETPVVCPSLRSLTIKGNNKRVIGKLWDLLTVPQLETLHATSHSSSLPLQNITNMLHRSSAFQSLTSLTLVYTYSKPGNDEQLLELLRHATNLTHLQFGAMHKFHSDMYPDVNTLCQFLLTAQQRSPSAHDSTLYSTSNALQVTDNITPQQIMLPKLTTLAICNVPAKCRPTIHWKVIADLFPYSSYHTEYPTAIDTQASSAVRSTNHHFERPLKTIHIRFASPLSRGPSSNEGVPAAPLYIDKESAQRFVDIELNRGKFVFELEVPDPEGPEGKMLDLLNDSISHWAPRYWEDGMEARWGPQSVLGDREVHRAQH